MHSLTNKAAIVTGSTSGIGLAYARAFAAAGGNIVLNGLGTPSEIEKERSAIESEFKVMALYSPADMTKPSDIAEMVTLGEKTFGSVDIVVNNAGIQFVSPIGEFPVDKWDAIIAINLSAACHAIRAAAPGMKKRSLGPDHQYRFRALAGGISLQGGLRLGQAWNRRPYQDRSTGACHLQDNLQLHQSGLCLDAARGEADS